MLLLLLLNVLLLFYYGLCPFDHNLSCIISHVSKQSAVNHLVTRIEQARNSIAQNKPRIDTNCTSYEAAIESSYNE